MDDGLGLSHSHVATSKFRSRHMTFLKYFQVQKGGSKCVASQALGKFLFLFLYLLSSHLQVPI